MTPELLHEMAELFAVESEHAEDVDESERLLFIALDLDAWAYRWSKEDEGGR